jgi:peptide/nickel transport system substrate-binding protein
MLKQKQFINVMLILTALFFVQCKGKSGDSGTVSFKGADKVKFHMLSDPDGLNPYNAQGEQRTYIAYHVHASLIEMDFKTYELVPTLATALPVFSEYKDGLSLMSFEIRPEAKWDNGTPITARDVEFSLMALMAPKTDNMNLKPFYEFIKGIIIDSTNPKKFDLIIEPYMSAESSMSGFPILPSYVYDAKNLLKDYSLNEMTANKAKLDEDPILDEFAANFNSEEFNRKTLVGAGPYTFDRWETNQRVVFKLKEDWWGHSLKAENHWLEAYPKEIYFETITDLTTAVVALKGESIDIMRGINPKDFVQDLTKNERFLERFNTFTPPQFSYDYIGLNLRNPKFADIKTRMALAHLMDVPQLVNSFCFGLGEPVASIIHPSFTSKLNPDVQPIPFDIEKAKQLLAEAGWGDSNGDGTLDKMHDGKLLNFDFTLNYNNGNDRRKTACLIFQEACRKVGINVNVQVLEWSNILEATKKHQFEAYVAGWISNPIESDPKQIWHTESYNDGSNYVGFGNEASDALIEKLRRELDAEKRDEYFKELQAMIRAEMPYIFLLAQKERIAIHKKFDGAEASGMRPGVFLNSLKPAPAM